MFFLFSFSKTQTYCYAFDPKEQLPSAFDLFNRSKYPIVNAKWYQYSELVPHNDFLEQQMQAASAHVSSFIHGYSFGALNLFPSLSVLSRLSLGTPTRKNPNKN